MCLYTYIYIYIYINKVSNDTHTHISFFCCLWLQHLISNQHLGCNTIRYVSHPSHRSVIYRACYTRTHHVCNTLQLTAQTYAIGNSRHKHRLPIAYCLLAIANYRLHIAHSRNEPAHWQSSCDTTTSSIVAHMGNLIQ